MGIQPGYQIISIDGEDLQGMCADSFKEHCKKRPLQLMVQQTAKRAKTTKEEKARRARAALEALKAEQERQEREQKEAASRAIWARVEARWDDMSEAQRRRAGGKNAWVQERIRMLEPEVKQHLWS